MTTYTHQMSKFKATTSFIYILMKNFWKNLGGDQIGEPLKPIPEIPAPDEMSEVVPTSSTSVKSRLTRSRARRHSPDHKVHIVHIQFLLDVIGAPSLPIISPHSINYPDVKTYREYVAASGGDALDLIENVSVLGKVTMAILNQNIKKSMNKVEHGTFVLYQQTRIRHAPWSLELMVSGSKMSAGCNGKVAWRQTPWRATCDPVQPLRRSLQGLDPKGVAELFSNSTRIGESEIDGQNCFLLEVESSQPSTSSAETIKHIVKGYFSHKTGLLIHLEDTHLRSVKTDGCELGWVTKTSSSIQDYRPVNGVVIAHGGRTKVSLSSGGEMEEIWSVEEIDFNLKGMSKDFFAAPAGVEDWRSRYRR
ncbi:uncharacterized protein LOC125213564 [Salvia hispanica]|uniref:uncharacterized protein LOC125213564 n=1 Tax=Salvia hispanica TaxID=49212 RepID=UPI00200959EC|nr:uncharacterized protein LOC125213564 [Salvia hispanica]